MTGVLENKRQAIAEVCQRHGVARLDAFGSALRDDFRPGESDVDLLVEFGPMDHTLALTPTSACSKNSGPCWDWRST